MIDKDPDSPEGHWALKLKQRLKERFDHMVPFERKPKFSTISGGK
jgi:hypothetical protein